MDILETTLAILPGLLICGWLFYRDRYQREPLVLLAICFAMGVASAFPCLFVQGIAADYGLHPCPHIGTTLLLTFGVVALCEELMKFSALMLFGYPWRVFDEPLDGIVYSVMVSMGFATIENVFYSNSFDLDVVVLRGVTAVPAHAAFAVIMGYFVGNAKFEANMREKFTLFAKGLGFAILVHGIYDFFLLQENMEWMVLLAMPVLAAAIYWSIMLIRKEAALSKRDYADSGQDGIRFFPRKK